MRVLITRPHAESESLAPELSARGHVPVVAPMLAIRVRPDAAVDLSDVQAVLFTSANGVRAFAALSDRRDVSVLAVGEASAAAARDAGFPDVASAGGDARDLAALARTRLDPSGGVLFHAAGAVTKGELKAELEAAGFAVRRVPLYDAQPAAELPPAARTALETGALDAVLFFSPRTARTFVRLVNEAGLPAASAPLNAVCLSKAVAAEAAALSWRGVRVAARPDRAALLDALETVAADGEIAPAVAKDDMNQDKSNKPEHETDPEDDPQDPHAESGHPAHAVIARFGGIRPMAHKLGVAVSTVQGWKNRGIIPAQRHEEVLAAAREHGVELDRSELAASSEESASPEAATPPATSGDTERESAAAEHAVGAEAAAARAGEAAGGEERAQPAAPGGAPVAPPPSRPLGWVPGMLLGAAILVAGVAAAVATRDQWLPRIGEQPAVQEARAERLRAIEERLADLQGTRTSVEDLSTTVADLEERLAAVESADGTVGGQQLEELRQQVGAIGDKVTQATQRIDSHAERLDTQAERVAEVSSRVETTVVGRVDGLADRVASLSGRLDEVATAAAEAEAVGSLQQRVETLGGRVAELKAQMESQENVEAVARAAAARQTMQALAVSELRDALRFSDPFQQALKAARKALPPDSQVATALDELAGHAARGIPTRSDLRQRFEPAAAQAMASAAGESEDGWVGGVLRRLNDVVTVRPVGEGAEGGTPGAILARAESRLEGGDLSGAVAAVEQLSGAPGKAMQPWLEQARARLKAEAALTRISARLTETLAQAGGGA